MTNLDSMILAVSEAESTLRSADLVAEKLARLLIGRLRRVPSAWVLRELKRELGQYNVRTSKWKEGKP